MATLEDLVNQYSTEIPDYLRKKAVAPVAAPTPAFVPPVTPLVLAPPVQKASETPANMTPQIVAALKKEADLAATPKTERTVVQTTEREDVSKQLEQVGKQRQMAEKQAQETRFAAKSALEAQAQRLLAEPQREPTEYAFSPETLSAIKEQENLLLTQVSKAPKMEAGPSALEQALIAFVPALVGAGIGGLAKVPGGAALGLGAGGQAGAETLKSIREQNQEKFKREVDLFVKNLDVSKEVFKQRIETLKEPELLKLKTAASFAVAMLTPAAEKLIKEGALRGLGQKQIAELPEVKAAETAQKQLEAIQAAEIELLKRGGVKKGTRIEVAPQKPGKAEKGEKSKLRGLTPAQTSQFAGYANAERELLDLATTVRNNKDLFGLLKGPVGSLNILDPQTRNRAKVLKSRLDQLVRSAAKAAEDGRLSDQDVRDWRETGVSLSDNPAIALGKISSFLKRINNEKENNLNALRAAGYDVSGFESMSAQEKARLQQLKAKQTPQGK